MMICRRFMRASCKSGSQTIGVALLLLLGAGATAGAEDLKFNAEFSEQGVWDSNPSMSSTEAKELYGVTSVPTLSVAFNTPASEAMASASVENNIFNRTAYNSTDFHGRVQLARRTQRLEAALRASGDYDTTRTSELTNLGSQTGTARHTAYAVAPSLTYALSQLSKVSVSGGYNVSLYEKASNNTDYHTMTLVPAYQRMLTEKLTGVFSVNLRRYETDTGVQRIVDSVGPSVGLIVKLMPKWSAEAHMGQQASREERAGQVVQDWTMNSIFSGKTTYSGDQDTFTFEANRSQQAYSNGNDSLLTTLSAKETRRIHELFTVNVGATYQFSDDKQESGNSLDSLYGGDAGLDYHVTDKVAISTSYQYRHESFTQEAAAERNVVRLGLTYKPQLEAAK